MKKDDPKYDSKRIHEWKKKNVKHYAMYFNLNTESDVLAHFEKQESKRQYIISLIRKDMDERSQS